MATYRIRSGCFNFEIVTNITAVSQYIDKMYGDYPAIEKSQPVDFQCRIVKGAGLRRLIKAQSRFFCGEHEPFKPLKLSQAHAFLEWGMNYCVSAFEKNYLILHAAVVAKQNKAVIFPAPPGSGKSTLTAYLSLAGWRLLSDEMAIIDLHTGELIPFVRPICLKNNSIDMVKQWSTDAVLSPLAKDTLKGNVSHLKPSLDSIKNADTRATLAAIVYPKYQQGQGMTIYQLDEANTFMQLAANAFNFSAIGAPAFACVSQLVAKVKKFEVIYEDSAEVQAFLQEDVLE